MDPDTAACQQVDSGESFTVAQSLKIQSTCLKPLVANDFRPCGPESRMDWTV
jgi:hypothetical protein